MSLATTPMCHHPQCGAELGRVGAERGGNCWGAGEPGWSWGWHQATPWGGFLQAPRQSALHPRLV